ncbi:hypothetical protein TNCV_4150401 [Trichonephila clavipes]|uniref:Uncharacterized protein n=1 Tax=Trichonephila clavipes TaxID=2585209 RepID=A0A8X7BFF1_TRICX|nr:hypothetical protein TNCV_4150401 [Trichonephila clavipes]
MRRKEMPEVGFEPTIETGLTHSLVAITHKLSLPFNDVYRLLKPNNPYPVVFCFARQQLNYDGVLSYERLKRNARVGFEPTIETGLTHSLVAITHKLSLPFNDVYRLLKPNNPYPVVFYFARQLLNYDGV